LPPETAQFDANACMFGDLEKKKPGGGRALQFVVR
jgi:hypothetical protein